MIEWIVSSAVLILVIVILRQLLKGKISLQLQYALWAIVLVRLLVPGSFGQSKLSVQNAVQAEQTAQKEPGEEAALPEFTIDIPPSRVDYVPPDLAISEPDPSLPKAEQELQYEQNKQQWQDIMDADWEEYKAEHTRHVTLAVTDVLYLIWFAGIAAVAVVFAVSNLKFWLMLRRSRVPLAANCTLPVYLSGAVETPCLFGLFRPAVYVTAEVAADPVALAHVLAHETTHFRHWDHLWAVLRCVCLAVHWYNPLVWLAASLSRRDAELACDDGAIRRIGEGERAAYGRTLIGLTCAHRGNLLHTATTMTGSKKSIKERIVLIAKKPKMAVYTLIAVILIAAIAVGCTFTGAEGPTLIDWTSTVSAEEISSVQIIKGQMPDQKKYDLPQDDFDELISIFRTITEDQLTLEDPGELALGVNIEYSMYVSTPTQGNPWLGWQFQCLEDGTMMLTFRDLETAEQYGYTEKTGVNPRIRSDALYRFITANGQLAVRQDAPETVLKQALEHIEQHRAVEEQKHIAVSMTHEVLAELRDLSLLELGTAGLDFAVEMWQLDYDVTVAFSQGQEANTTGHTVWMVFLYDYTAEEYTQFLGAVELLTLQNVYNTPEMIDKYENMYRAASMEMYQHYLEERQLMPIDPSPTPVPDPEAERIAYFQDLLGWDAGETWYNGALTCVYTAPEDIFLDYVFYTAFPGGEEWHDFTAEEQAWLISEGAKKNLGFGNLPAQKRPAKQLDALLQQYFGVSLDQAQMPDSWVYYEATDSWYSCHGGIHVVEGFTVTQVADGGNGVYHIYYTITRGYALNPATGQTYADLVLTLRENQDGSYTVLSNLPVSGRGIVLEEMSLSPKAAAEKFVRVYGADLLAIPGYMTDYEVEWCEVEEISADMDAVVGCFRYSVPQGNGDDYFALSELKKGDDGRWYAAVYFLLERFGGDGKWYCSQWADGNTGLYLADYGYEDGMIDAIMGNTAVYRCEGTDPNEAAVELVAAYVEDLMVPDDLRSFTITQYRNLTVEVTPTLELDEAAISQYIYGLSEDEIGENIWIVEFNMEYRWTGVIHGPPNGPGDGLPDDVWVEGTHQGNPLGFLLTREGDEFTLQSRYDNRY